MMIQTNWRNPASVLHWLGLCPVEQPVALLLRHAARAPLPPDGVGYTLPITEAGAELGRELGRLLGRRLRSLRSSPLVRCLQTAEVLRGGAGADLPIVSDRLLGDPGIYVIDEQLAWTQWQTLGHEGVMHHLVSSSHALPGMSRPDEAARAEGRAGLCGGGDPDDLCAVVV